MTNPDICAALEKAAEAVLFDLKDRKGVGNEIEQCDDDIQAEIGRTVAAKAIHAFHRALPMILDRELHCRPDAEEEPYPDFDAIAEAVLAAAKEDRE
jgi:hypothetical protein